MDDTMQHTGPGPRVAVVCLGNICRSPMADVVLNARLAEAGADVVVHSFGTASWHVGKPMDERSAATLSARGYDATQHRASHFTAAHAGAYDLVLAMDEANHADLLAIGVPADRLRRFRDFDPEPGDGNVPDPYYGGEEGFHDVLAMIERSADAILAHVTGVRR
ncbi:low molecular weight protein-tyrosine-phosphatase [Nocardioides sp. AE5]|uniref:low molecular weight protein-tyrosine-phosphatase n=1 Tax=Nocardioides sp. AE5 TaxID=2962573 RepID=UPI002881E9D2|nr:low molecular weight protein-tyrosine-phosphatase [Nocardioides sp. AE5]MDT0203410.1 low molecular weight protein-tyrosine-phosphatase [Nocardioides sp. AE5]